MPGVKLAIEKVVELKSLVYGLENILDVSIKKHFYWGDHRLAR